MDVAHYLASLGENLGRLLGSLICIGVPIALVVVLVRRRKTGK